MRHFKRIATRIDVSGVLSDLEQNADLWNANTARTSPESPHYGVPDIWVRYRAPEELTTPEAFREPHFAMFYPAWKRLQALEPIVFGIMKRARPRAVGLGGILITKIPAGGSVKPHHDRGGWHAEFYNTKIYVGIKSNPHCVNYCEGEQIVINEGDAVTFDNLLTHSVENRGDTDRITLIICLRTES